MGVDRLRCFKNELKSNDPKCDDLRLASLVVCLWSLALDCGGGALLLETLGEVLLSLTHTHSLVDLPMG